MPSNKEIWPLQLWIRQIVADNESDPAGGDAGLEQVPGQLLRDHHRDAAGADRDALRAEAAAEGKPLGAVKE